MVKILKTSDNKNFTGYLVEKLHLDQNIEQFIYYFVAFIVLNHLSACSWYYLAKITDFEVDCWVFRLGLMDRSPFEVSIHTV